MNTSQLTPQALAHELNSLLDGALRWLSLAQQTTREIPDDVAQQRDTIAQRQDSTLQAMQKMAELLARAQAGGQLDMSTLQSNRTLEQELDHVLSLFAPQCAQHGVELLHELDPRAAALSAGILAPIMSNGLRNAIESCSQPGLSTRRVSISVALRSRGCLQLLIEDSGAGLPQPLVFGTTTKPDGHGLGLSLCRALVDQCGGILELANVPYGGGAVLSVRLDPLHAVQQGADAA